MMMRTSVTGLPPQLLDPKSLDGDLLCDSHFGSPAISGPSGSHPWLLKGSEDPWLSVPDFGQVWLFVLFGNPIVSINTYKRQSNIRNITYTRQSHDS